jgi:hypothetical protein
MHQVKGLIEMPTYEQVSPELIMNVLGKDYFLAKKKQQPPRQRKRRRP